MSEKKEAEETEKKVFRLSEADPKFKYELSKAVGAEKLMMCFQCGTCTADCPIARFSGSYRPSQILRMALFGMKSKVLSSDDIWLCAACFTCIDRCPRDVEFANVLRVLRNLAVKEGFIPAVFREMGLNIVKSASAYEIPELRLKKREELGLPPLPKFAGERVTKLAEIVGFTKLMEKSKGEK